MQGADYYNLLGISPKATKRELTIAYRRLAFKYHPDRSSKSAQSIDFREINEAYRILNNPHLRAAYDRSRMDHSAAKNQNTNQPQKEWLIQALEKFHGWKDEYWKLTKQAFRQATEGKSKKIYSELELSKTLAEQGGFQEFSFQIINQDDEGKEVSQEKKLKISIPAKVKDGTVLHLKGFQDEAIDEILFKVRLVN